MRFTAEQREAINKGIMESDLRGYKWKLKGGLLHWSYLDCEFRYELRGPGNEILLVIDTYSEVEVASVWFDEENKYAEASSLTEAFYMATRRAISYCNYFY